MLTKTAITALLLSSLSSCSLMQRVKVRTTENAPSSVLLKRAQEPWWRQYSDAALNNDIATAIAANPDLRAVAIRIAQADAAIASADATLLPRVNLGFGYQTGRKREADFGPYSLAPWRSGAAFSWELDLSGKLRAARQSAKAGKNASIWDYHAARLELASRVAAVRFNLYRFNAEINSYQDSVDSSKRILSFLKEQLGAGLIAESEVNKQQAEHARLERQRLDVIRLRDLSIVQLHTLRGGTSPSKTLRHSFPKLGQISNKPVSQLLASHPSLLAAESRVRAAFQLEQSAKLNLLPSFSIGAGLSGGQTSLTNRYRVWTAKIGPSLDIPIYDPSRLAAVKARKAQRVEASAHYQKAVLKVLAEVESARINLHSRSAQLEALNREIAALKTRLRLSREQFQAGLISQTDYLVTERSWLESTRSEAALKQAEMNAHLDLVKAFGGGG